MADPRGLVLLRHGRTAWNAERRVQGQEDVELDEAGHTQAAAVAPYVAAMAPAVLWSSDLARARQTADYLAKETGLEPRLDPRLREFRLGERQGLTHAEYAAAAPAEFAEFRRGDFDVVPGGESTRQVAARMTDVLLAVLGDLAPGESALVVSHGAAIRVAVASLLGWPEGLVHSLLGLDNCAWAELHESGPDGRLRLAAYNRTVGGPPDFVSASGVG